MDTDTNADDNLIPLADVPGELPRRDGRKTHIATIYRWTTVGCRGQVLRYVQVGAKRCTSRRWLNEFFERLTVASKGGVARTSAPPVLPSAARRRALERAERELEAAGL